MKRSEYEAKLKKYEEEMKELKKCIKELKNEEIEEIEEDFLWKLKYKENYWFIDILGKVHKDIWRYTYIDNVRFNMCNVFRTEEEAKHEVEYRKVLSELKQFSREFIYGYRNFYINLSNDTNISYKYRSNVRVQGVIYFESEEKIKEAIKSVGEYRIKKYIFGVE